jgi:allantoinase
MEAWGGISSLQLLIQATWTAGKPAGMTLGQLAECLSTNPAWVAGLDRRKGAISPGLDADLVVFDPDAEKTIFAASLQHRHPISPYDGMTLQGHIEDVWIRGRKDQTGIMLRRG